MVNKKILIILFIAVSMIQLYVPAGMILEREDTLKTGWVFKFRTAPLDPSDPFRGKYVRLDFRDNVFEEKSDKEWKGGETVFAQLTTDIYGYAKVNYISHIEPADNLNYIKTKIRYVNKHEGILKVHLDFPFDRFYMQETKAPVAERKYLESLSDTNNVTYAIVKVKKGSSVLEDVKINDISLRELVNAEQ